jgi:arylsulfatase A-like enzyme
LAEVLRQNGFNTAQFGKCHEVPAWEISNNGPQDRWPTRSGFEKFYGFLGGETNQWAPLIYDGVTLVETPDVENYHFTTDMTNQAINWMNVFKTRCSPISPFLCIMRPVLRTRPTMHPKSLSPDTKVNSIWAGTSCANKPLRAK